MILCRIYLDASCFNVKKDIAASLEIQRRLNKNEVPTINVANKPLDTVDESLRSREKRKVRSKRAEINF